MYSFEGVYAQQITDFYQKPNQSSKSIGYRAGVNYSIPTVTAAVVSNSLTTSYLAGVNPQLGFFLGGFYLKELLPDRLTFRVDATLQMKGTEAMYNGKPVKKSRYYSLGLTPMVGIHLTNKLIAYTGIEANWQAGRQNAWGKGHPFEVGTTLRFTYPIKEVKVEIGYFKGFTRFDTFEAYNFAGGPAINAFYNQNLQVGILFNLR
ncbi:hypothetical protein [Spirosoma aerophilum]